MYFNSQHLIYNIRNAISYNLLYKHNTTSVGVVTKRLQCLQVMFKFSADLIGRSGFFLPPLYMPYQCLDNQELYMEYIGKISAIVEDSSTSNVILLGDFNADVDTLFETELMEMCDSLNLLISDYSIFGRSSGQYTRVSDAHNTTSWLDHIICSHDVQKKLVCINILDRLPCSDHLPLSVSFDFNCDPLLLPPRLLKRTKNRQTSHLVGLN